MAKPLTDILAAIRKDMDKRLLATAVLLQGEAKRDLSKSFPPASKPGEYPAARTLNLRDAVAVVKIDGGYRVGYLPSAQYIVHLADRGRLTVVDTSKLIRPRLLRIIHGG